jgi:diaminopimelate decarboxylase
MNKRQPILPNDPDLQGATIALKRAARHARELAERTGTPCWVMRNGKIVDAVTGKEATSSRR